MTTSFNSLMPTRRLREAKEARRNDASLALASTAGLGVAILLSILGCDRSSSSAAPVSAFGIIPPESWGAPSHDRYDTSPAPIVNWESPDAYLANVAKQHKEWSKKTVIERQEPGILVIMVDRVDINRGINRDAGVLNAFPDANPIIERVLVETKGAGAEFRIRLRRFPIVP